MLVKPMGDSPSRIDEELRYDFLLFAPFGARMLTFIPKWAKYFDSHNCPVLPDANWRYVPPEKVPKRSESWRNVRNALVEVVNASTSLFCCVGEIEGSAGGSFPPA